MRISEASAEDLVEVATAGSAYLAHWNSFKSMPDRGQTFTGSVADIAALDYLDYEQLGHPSGGLVLTALVWGNVLVAQADLQWFRGEGGDFWLGAEILGVKRAILWPYARILEAKSRDYPQFDQFGYLMLHVIEELDSQLDLPSITHTKLNQLHTSLTGIA